MPYHVWSAQHEHELEHLHRLVHQGDSVLEQKRPASLVEGTAAPAARQALARQTEGWP